jgi:hypothetical protein
MHYIRSLFALSLHSLRSLYARCSTLLRVFFDTASGVSRQLANNSRRSSEYGTAMYRRKCEEFVDRSGPFRHQAILRLLLRIKTKTLKKPSKSIYFVFRSRKCPLGLGFKFWPVKIISGNLGRPQGPIRSAT